jgi:hypothetical protein
MCNGALADINLGGGGIGQLTTSISLTTNDGMFEVTINS